MLFLMDNFALVKCGGYIRYPTRMLFLMMPKLVRITRGLDTLAKPRVFSYGQLGL